MKKLRILILIAAALVMCFVLCACKTPDNPNPDNPDVPNVDGEIMVMVAAYKQNAVADGKALITVENEYAFIPYGKEIKSENVVKYTYESDISNLVGTPAIYEVKDSAITSVSYAEKPVSNASYCYEYGDDKVIKLYDGTEVKLSENLVSNPEKFYFVLDGMHFTSGDPDGVYGFDRNNDDNIALYDIDSDGKYDYAVYTPIYNALTVESVDGTNVVLSGGYGSAAWLDIFAEDNKTAISFKKSLSGVNPKKGMVVNAKIIVDSSLGNDANGISLFAKFVSETKVETGHLNASIWKNETDIMSRVNSGVKYWSKSTSTNDASSGRKAVDATALGKVFDFAYDDAGYIVHAVASTSADVDYESLAGYTTFETANGTEAAGVFDVQTMWGANTTYSTLSAKVSMLYNLGIRRLYVVVSNPGYPQFSASNVGYSKRTNYDATTASFKYLGYEAPDHAFAQICHDKGMECYAIYKVYEGGGMAYAATGGTLEEGTVASQTPLGQVYILDKFLQETLPNGEDYRVCRRPDGANDNLEGTVDKITIDFVTGSYVFRAQGANRDAVRTESAIAAARIKGIANGKYSKSDQHPAYAISLWTSKDNFSYSLYEGEYEYEYVEDNKVLYDCNGTAMFDGKPIDVLTLTITNIKSDDSFFAVTFENTVSLRTDPYSFMHLWSGDREIVSTSTDMARHPGYTEPLNPEDYIWGRGSVAGRSNYCKWIKVDENGNLELGPRTDNSEHGIRSHEAIGYFPQFGFQFHFECYTGVVRDGNTFIAAGRGKVETFPGGLCEGYDEVRAYWLSCVERILRGSFDGVLIRLQAHSSAVTDYKNFGFNEPIIEKYKELYGEAAYNTLMDPDHAVTDEEYIRIMRIRGDYLTLFFEDAADLCHQYGAEFSVYMRDAYIDPQTASNTDEATWWTMPKVVLDWKRVVDLCDFVAFKDYISVGEIYSNGYEIKEYAKKQGKDVWIITYDDQGGNFTNLFFNTAIDDKQVDGILLYELTDILKYTSNGLKETLQKSGFEVTFKEDLVPKE